MNFQEETTTGASMANPRDERVSTAQSKSKSRQSNAEARRKLENFLAERALERKIRDVFDDYDM